MSSSEAKLIAPIHHDLHYAVIFTSLRKPDDGADYGLAADQMLELAAQQEGFLGVESARGTDGLGITVSYWKTLEAIAAWRNVAEHRNVQRLGRELWYSAFATRICEVKRSYDFQSSDSEKQ
ncbi:MAG: antibiotic biosynthesis monooxygenase family protein [Aureliella sp.]